MRGSKAKKIRAMMRDLPGQCPTWRIARRTWESLVGAERPQPKPLDCKRRPARPHPLKEHNQPHYYQGTGIATVRSIYGHRPHHRGHGTDITPAEIMRMLQDAEAAAKRKAARQPKSYPFMSDRQASRSARQRARRGFA